ncbi:MAG: CIA30 family protein [Pseudomonadota bacterium]
MLITDFTAASADLGWRVVNDNVMGGRSDGGFDVVDDELRFAGITNTRGGGFSSIRSQPLDLDLTAYTGIRVRVRADGRRYTWRLTTDARIYGREVAYWANFATVADEWQEVDIPFADFVPRFRGRTLDGPPLDTSQIRGMGLMIYDNLDGPFALTLDSVQAYASAAPFSLDTWRWTKRVLVVSAPSSGHTELQTQLEAIETTRARFEDRDLVLVTLLDGAEYTAGQRVLSDDDVRTLRGKLQIAQGAFAVRLIGKDGTVKLVDDKAVTMDELYALIDRMPMRRREIADR